MPGRYTYDDLGVRVRETPFGLIDAGIAKHIEDINKLGYTTVQSMSGLWEDYKEIPERYSPDGYIAFFKDELTEKQVNNIEQAAEIAGLVVSHTPVFFSPAISVRSGVTQQGTSFGEIHKYARDLANRKALLWGFTMREPEPSQAFPGQMRKPAPDFGDDWKARSRWSKLLDEIAEERIEEEGAPTDEDTKARWNRFVDALETLS